MYAIKRFLLALYEQLVARYNLRHVRDRRAFAIRLGRALYEGAQIWPTVLPRRPNTILDVGAHRGQVAEQLAELYHPAFLGLVEPLPEMVALLQQKKLAPQQQVFSCALGREEGWATLQVLASLPSSSLLEVNPESASRFQRPMDKIGTIRVPMHTLDTIFEQCGLQHLDLLKIDVQGYEMEVFHGGVDSLKKTGVIVAEVSFFEHYIGQPLFEQVYHFLHDLGFELRSTFGYTYDHTRPPGRIGGPARRSNRIRRPTPGGHRPQPAPGYRSCPRSQCRGHTPHRQRRSRSRTRDR